MSCYIPIIPYTYTVHTIPVADTLNLTTFGHLLAFLGFTDCELMKRERVNVCVGECICIREKKEGA